jgi:hypothetical protein
MSGILKLKIKRMSVKTNKIEKVCLRCANKALRSIRRRVRRSTKKVYGYCDVCHSIKSVIYANRFPNIDFHELQDKFKNRKEKEEIIKKLTEKACIEKDTIIKHQYICELQKMVRTIGRFQRYIGILPKCRECGIIFYGTIMNDHPAPEDHRYCQDCYDLISNGTPSEFERNKPIPNLNLTR